MKFVIVLLLCLSCIFAQTRVQVDSEEQVMSAIQDELMRQKEIEDRIQEELEIIQLETPQTMVDEETVEQAARILEQSMEEEALELADFEEEEQVWSGLDDKTMEQFLLEQQNLTEWETEGQGTLRERQLEEGESFEVSSNFPERTVECRAQGCLRGIQVSERHHGRMITYTFRHDNAECRVGKWAIDLGRCADGDVRIVGCARRRGGATWTCGRLNRLTNSFTVDLSTCDSVTLIFNREVTWERQSMLLQSAGRNPDCGVCNNIIVPVCTTRPGRLPVCGNGIVESGEECDPPGDCCTRRCQWSSTEHTCRARNGRCDLPETCTGRSDQCPRDKFLPRGSYCMCDNRNLRGECTGRSPFCHTRQGQRCEN